MVYNYFLNIHFLYILMSNFYSGEDPHPKINLFKTIFQVLFTIHLLII
jgi:hypothetical protein